MDKYYPRPQFRRKNYMILDGEWDFIEDEDGEGERKSYPLGFQSEEKINVPFSPECAASLINRQDITETIWYQTSFDVTDIQPNQLCILNFDGVDYIADIWVNGIYLGGHTGGYARFSLDVTSALKDGENLLIVKVQDSFNLEQPRGKQRWLDHNYSCWYVQTSGIWKSVWLEIVSDVRLDQIKMTPIIQNYNLKLEYFLNCQVDNVDLEIEIYKKGSLYKKQKFSNIDKSGTAAIDMNSMHEEFQVAFWRPENPQLYDINLKIYHRGELVDEVDSYFGFRDFRQEDGRLCLNGMPVYERLVLYQGYWTESGLTPPSEEAIIQDLEAIKAMGFNGVRIHQKIETDRFIYHADRLGLLVWCEMPSPHLFNDNMKVQFTTEWMEILRQQYNHPSIVTWLIFNESWGARGIRYDAEMQAFANGLYYLTKGFDSMRPVIANDGWEQVLTDIISIHNYEQNSEKLYNAYADREKAMSQNTSYLIQHPVFASGYGDSNLPVIFSEFGGCGFKTDTGNGDWVYSSANSEDEFYERYQSLIQSLKKLDYSSGFCYTQFSDVEQEKNGLFTMDRKSKVDFEIIRKINLEASVISTELLSKE